MRSKSLIALLAAATILSACGRKGPLEAPSASANPAAANGAAQPAPVEDKPFILDGLIQ
jgi:predicted small lipoprotein YifL